jgi:hypothetical protein
MAGVALLPDFKVDVTVPKNQAGGIATPTTDPP